MGSKASSNTRNAREGEPAAEWVSTDSLVPWDKNPRLNDGEPTRRVAESIKRFGFASPIVARLADRVIIAGHTRWKAAQSLKLDRVPVRFVDLDPADARLLALADNRYTEMTEWDEPALASLLSDIGIEGAEFAGWSSKDLDKMADGLLDGADDETSKLKTDFSVLVECSSESEQLDVLAECESKGWQCRALI